MAWGEDALNNPNLTDALIAMGASLNSGASRYPVGFGQGISQAALAGNEAWNNADKMKLAREKAEMDMLVHKMNISKMEQEKNKIEQELKFNDELQKLIQKSVEADKEAKELEGGVSKAAEGLQPVSPSYGEAVNYAQGNAGQMSYANILANIQNAPATYGKAWTPEESYFAANRVTPDEFTQYKAENAPQLTEALQRYLSIANSPEAQLGSKLRGYGGILQNMSGEDLKGILKEIIKPEGLKEFDTEKDLYMGGKLVRIGKTKEKPDAVTSNITPSKSSPTGYVYVLKNNAISDIPAPAPKSEKEKDKKPDVFTVALARDLPKQEKEASTAVASLPKFDIMINFRKNNIEKGGSSALFNEFKAQIDRVASTKATSEAALNDILSKTIAGSFRAEVIGQGQVSNFEQQILQKVSGGNITSDEAALKLLEHYRDLAYKKIGEYQTKRDKAVSAGFEGADLFTDFSKVLSSQKGKASGGIAPFTRRK